MLEFLLIRRNRLILWKIKLVFLRITLRKTVTGLLFGGYVDEGISGTTSRKRENFMRMIEDGSNNKFDLLITKEVSRFSRDTIDSLLYTRKLLEYDVCVYFLSDNIITASSDGELRLTIMSSMAQDEVRKISERTKFGLMGAAKKGHFSGKAPIGYRKINKELVIDEVESEVVKDIFKSYLSGLSVCAIAKKLNEKNALNRNWRTTTIDRMLSNYIYAGNYQHRKRIQNEETILLEDVCPSIIDKHDFELVQKQKEKNLKNYTRKHTYVYNQRCQQKNTSFSLS